MPTLTISGYSRIGTCEHCGRELVHVIKLDDGRRVGATCFSKVLTKPQIYAHRAYRLSPAAIIDLARVAESGKLARYGVTLAALTFEAA